MTRLRVLVSQEQLNVHQLAREVHAAIKPRDFLERLLADDVTQNQARIYRGCRGEDACLTSIATQEIEKFLRQMLPDDLVQNLLERRLAAKLAKQLKDRFRAELLASQFIAGKPEARRRVEDLLKLKAVDLYRAARGAKARIMIRKYRQGDRAVIRQIRRLASAAATSIDEIVTAGLCNREGKGRTSGFDNLAQLAAIGQRAAAARNDAIHTLARYRETGAHGQRSGKRG
jgi:hypothetical protein